MLPTALVDLVDRIEAGDPDEAVQDARRAVEVSIRSAQALQKLAEAQEVANAKHQRVKRALDVYGLNRDGILNGALTELEGDRLREVSLGLLGELMGSDTPKIRAVNPIWDAEPSERLMWRPGDAEGELLSVGSLAILSGSGGVGKSTVMLALALASRTAEPSCGVCVRPKMPVVIGSMEDSPAHVANRMKWLAPPEDWCYVRLLNPMPPMWRPPENAADRGGGPSDAWQSIWEAVAGWVGEHGPGLVILDPAAGLIGGADASDASTTRAFLQAVGSKAEELSVGVLMVAHDTKQARDETTNGKGPGAGAIQGSSQWWDAARGVLHLAESTDHRRVLVALKANHGPVGWGAVLRPRKGPNGDRYPHDRWRGLEFQESLSGADDVTAARESQRPERAPDAQLLEKVLGMAEEGRSQREIAAETGVPRTTVRRWIQEYLDGGPEGHGPGHGPHGPSYGD